LNGEFTPNQVVKLLQPAFPEAKVLALQRLPGGFVNHLYLVDLERPTARVVLKIYLQESAKQKPEKETWVLRRVASEAGVPVPHVIYFDGERRLIEHPYAIHTWVPGEPLERLLPTMDEFDQETVGYDMGRYAAKMHHVAAPRFGEFLSPDPLAGPDEAQYVRARVERWLEPIQAHSLLEPYLVRRVRQQLDTTPHLAFRSPCLVHGDYHEANVHVERGVVSYHVTGVFDFEHAQGWSPEWDLVKLYGYAFDTYPALSVGFLKGYTDTHRLPEPFAARLHLYRLIGAVGYVAYFFRTGEVDKLREHVACIRTLLD
jgi:Ser/Thr protein kinase RdoA (MazF antagonist)